MSAMGIVDGVSLIGQEAKGHTYRYLKTIGEHINLVFYAHVVIERVAVKVTELRDVPL